MFWFGLIIGAFVGSAISFFIIAICQTSGMADDYAERTYQTMHRGDDNGDN